MLSSKRFCVIGFQIDGPPPFVQIEIEKLVSSGQDRRGYQADRRSHPANSTLTVAWTTHSRIKAFGLEFSNDGRTDTPHRFPGRRDLCNRAVLLIGKREG